MDLDISTHLDAAILPLSIALYVVGVFLKATPKLRDWLIPWILLPFSIVAAIIVLGVNMNSVIQGVLACGLAVMGSQLFKQAKEGLNRLQKSNQ